MTKVRYELWYAKSDHHGLLNDYREEFLSLDEAKSRAERLVGYGYIHIHLYKRTVTEIEL